MQLKELKENRAVAGQLSSLLRSHRAVHAFLFVGPPACAQALGLAFSRALLCPEGDGDSCGVCLACRRFDHGNCEDFLTVECTQGRQSIVVSQIEELQEAMKYKPFGSARVVLVKDAHLMNQAAQNKLLKTLEEPSPGNYMILLAQGKENLLPTIQSRCSTYILQESTAAAAGETADAAEHFLLLVRQGAAYYEKKNSIRYILDAKDEARQKALEFLEALECALYKRALSCAADPAGTKAELDKISAAVSLCGTSMADLRASRNTAYVLKTLCLKL